MSSTFRDLQPGLVLIAKTEDACHCTPEVPLATHCSTCGRTENRGANAVQTSRHAPDEVVDDAALALVVSLGLLDPLFEQQYSDSLESPELQELSRNTRWSLNPALAPRALAPGESVAPLTSRAAKEWLASTPRVLWAVVDPNQ
jgi:hypothetical protein